MKVLTDLDSVLKVLNMNSSLVESTENLFEAMPDSILRVGDGNGIQLFTIITEKYIIEVSRKGVTLQDTTTGATPLHQTGNFNAFIESIIDNLIEQGYPNLEYKVNISKGLVEVVFIYGEGMMNAASPDVILDIISLIES